MWTPLSSFLACTRTALPTGLTAHRTADRRAPDRSQSVSLARLDVAVRSRTLVGSGGDGEESPRGGDAFEVVFAAVVECRARTRYEIDDGSGHEDLAGLCGFADATCQMDGDAGEFGVAPFDFTSVDPDPDFQADLAGGVADRDSTADRAGGAVEGGEDPVAGELLLVTGEPGELAAYGVVVAVQDRTPGPVAERGDPVGGADHVGEQQGGERSGVVGGHPDAGA